MRLWWISLPALAAAVACGCNFRIGGVSIPEPSSSHSDGALDLASSVPGIDLSDGHGDAATTPDLADSCLSSCATSCSPCCVDKCGLGETCNFSCPTDTCTCGFTCQAGSACMANCGGGSTCAVAVQAGLTVTVSCSGKATCDVDCTAAVSCTVNCGGGSHCLCAGAGCAFNQCNPTTCPNGVKVCGRPCP